MTSHSPQTSPQVYARLGGVLYLIIIAIGLFGELFVRGRFIIANDAVNTAANLQTMESLWRLHIAAELVLLVCAVTVLWILFVLLRPVNPKLVMLAVLFNIIGIALEAAHTLHLLEALFPLDNAGYLAAFTPEQLATLARFQLRSFGYGFGLSLVFFGFFCLIIGYLIFKSGYLPRPIGILMVVAGLGYLVNNFALVLAPAFADQIFVIAALPSFIGELLLSLWFLIKGVNVPAWQKRSLDSAW
jgi:hypothetical protein